mgnify:CR=1 FL=1
MKNHILIFIFLFSVKIFAQDSSFVFYIQNIYSKADSHLYSKKDSSFIFVDDSVKILNYIRYFDSEDQIRKSVRFNAYGQKVRVSIYNSNGKSIFSFGLYDNNNIKSLRLSSDSLSYKSLVFNWYKSGALKNKYSIVNGCISGIFQEWWPNGNLKVQFNNEIEYAPFTYYYDDGKVWMKGTAFYGKTFVGDFIEYSKTGEILKQGKYRKNKNDNRCEDNTEKVGVWSYYNNKTNTYIEIDETKLREDKAREDKLEYNKRKALKEKEEGEKIEKINKKNLEKNPKAPIIFYVE